MGGFGGRVHFDLIFYQEFLGVSVLFDLRLLRFNGGIGVYANLPSCSGSLLFGFCAFRWLGWGNGGSRTSGLCALDGRVGHKLIDGLVLFLAFFHSSLIRDASFSRIESSCRG